MLELYGDLADEEFSRYNAYILDNQDSFYEIDNNG